MANAPVESPIDELIEELFDGVSALSGDTYIREAIGRYIIRAVVWGCNERLAFGAHDLAEHLTSWLT
jgi:hypothetical protein